MNKNIVIIGASCFQNPLILRAKELGYTTHVFAWQSDDVGEKTADYFYPISIIEMDRILEVCRKIAPVGIASIGSDLASVTVNYVAEKLGLICNGYDSALIATNKHLMRQAFERAGIPSCKSMLVSPGVEPEKLGFKYPLIIKPTDRSGSRGIYKVCEPSELAGAIEKARGHSFEKQVLMEEFITGREYSIEYISWQGKHTFLACTEKFTTGAPLFVETGHLQPAYHMNDGLLQRIQELVPRVLDCLGVKYGASHTELKIDGDSIRLIETGARMGGDCIGSDLVYISRGIDFVGATAQVACGVEPDLEPKLAGRISSIRFIFSKDDLNNLEYVRRHYPECIYRVSNIFPIDGHEIRDSSTRYGYYILATETMDKMREILSHLELGGGDA